MNWAEQETKTTLPKGLPWRELEKICPGRVAYAIPMSRLTTLRVGGPADALVMPASTDEVAAVIRWARRREVPLFIAGRGSNLLVLDGGIRGVVMRVGSPMDRWRIEGDGPRSVLRAEAGLPLRRLLREAIRHGWQGMEFLVGIPGSLGGAIAMNAGTREGTMGKLVESLTWVDSYGGIVESGRRDLAFSYRRLALPRGSALVSAALRLTRGESEEIRNALRRRMRHRQASQPYGSPTAGSIFKNPPGDYAGRIIDSLGLKGLTRGGAHVSRKHANFIVTDGHASAADVLRLIQEIRHRVAQATGLCLELEVQVVGGTT